MSRMLSLLGDSMRSLQTSTDDQSSMAGDADVDDVGSVSTSTAGNGNGNDKSPPKEQSPSPPSEEPPLLPPHAEAQVTSLTRRLQALVALPTNRSCADCPATEATWASLLVPPPGTADRANLLSAARRSRWSANAAPSHKSNHHRRHRNRHSHLPYKLGVLCCDQCYLHHAQLGKQICRVKNTQDAHEWTEDEVEALERAGGNDIVNFIYEAKLSTSTYNKRESLDDPQADAIARHSFVRHKYQQLRYFDASLYEMQIHDVPPQSTTLLKQSRSKRRHNQSSLYTLPANLAPKATAKITPRKNQSTELDTNNNHSSRSRSKTKAKANPSKLSMSMRAPSAERIRRRSRSRSRSKSRSKYDENTMDDSSSADTYQQSNLYEEQHQHQHNLPPRIRSRSEDINVCQSQAPRAPRRLGSHGKDDEVPPRRPSRGNLNGHDDDKNNDNDHAPTRPQRRRLSLPSSSDEAGPIGNQYPRRSSHKPSSIGVGIDLYSPQFKREKLVLGLGADPAAAINATKTFGYRYGFQPKRGDSSDSDADIHSTKAKAERRGSTGGINPMDSPALGCFLVASSKEAKVHEHTILDEQSVGTKDSNDPECIAGIGPSKQQPKQQQTPKQHRLPSVPSLASASEDENDNRRLSIKARSSSTNALSNHFLNSNNGKHKKKRQSSDTNSLSALSAVSGFSFGSKSSDDEGDVLHAMLRKQRHKAKQTQSVATATTSDTNSTWASKRYDTDSESPDVVLSPEALGYITDDGIANLLAGAKKVETPSTSLSKLRHNGR